MDYAKFYSKILSPFEERYGKFDSTTLSSLIGFDAGGPLSFSTIGRGRSDVIATYVSCELACRGDQKPSANGRYEISISCDDESWVRRAMSRIGEMSLDAVLGDGHTVDIGPIVNGAFLSRRPKIQAVLMHLEYSVEFAGEEFCVLRCIGITRAELKFARTHGSHELLSLLKQARVFPNTLLARKSVV